MSIIEKLNWRYATKKFDQNKKLSAEQLDNLLEATRLSASSYGLQPYQVIVVENPEVRKALREVAWGQPQITEASQLIVFAYASPVNEQHVEEYVDNIVKTRGIDRESLAGFEGMMKGTVNSLSDADKATWAAKQAYIGLGTLLAAAATMDIDACPMEGFDAAKFNEILGLKEKGLSAAVIATVGFRAEDDDFQHYKKVRKAKEDFLLSV